jgi:hypothetical protein
LLLWIKRATSFVGLDPFRVPEVVINRDGDPEQPQVLVALAHKLLASVIVGQRFSYFQMSSSGFRRHNPTFRCIRETTAMTQ